MSLLPMLPSHSETFSNAGDYQYITKVVQIGYSLRAARSYLSRHIGNQIHYQLLEVERGEEVGTIREAEVRSCDGGPTVLIYTQRTLPDGSPASFFTPKELVEIQTIVETDDGSPVPTLRSNDIIILYVPVRSYLRFLPGLYRGSTPMMRQDVMNYDERSQRQLSKKSQVFTAKTTFQQSDQFQRFMLMFQHMMMTVLDRIDHIPLLTDPLRVDAAFLPWLSSWVNFYFDASLPLHQQRELIRRAIRLQRMRGTSAGIAEMIQILTSTPVTILERKKPQACVLGKMRLAGGKTIAGRFLRKEPPGSYIVAAERKPMSFFVIKLEAMPKFYQRFGERSTDILRQIILIVTREMPAHVVFTIQFEDHHA